MSAIEQDVASDTRSPSKGPGERLQAARIKQGLTIADVANRMHLSTGILEALEENNFEEITAPIFVKGYLRAYARIVSLDEEEMIGLYTEYHRDEDPPISTINNVGNELTAADARIRWTTYLVILVLATLLGAWWWNRQNAEPTSISLDSQPETEVQADVDAPRPVIEAVSESVEPRQAAPDASTATAVVEVDDGEPPALLDETPVDLAGGLPEAQTTRDREETVEPAESAGEVGQAPVALEVASQDEAPSASTAAGESENELPTGGVSSAVSSDDSAPLPASETVASGAAASLPSVIAPSGSERLALVVHADTWADIKDGSGFRLVYDLLRAGSSIELTGEAPFTVFLGNGHGVEISYNDAAIDFSADIRGNNTARLNIGE